jgi:hypothetical protein
MDEEGKLEIRLVQVIFNDVDQVYVSEGLAEGEKLVVTDIAAPVEGMALRIAPAEGQSPAGQDQTPGPEGGRP